MADDKKTGKAQAAEDFVLPKHLEVAPDAFDNIPGEVYGGTSDILMLEIGEAAGPLTYTGHREVDLGLGPVVLHEAKDSEGKAWRLPIAANFVRQLETANINRDDVFIVKRIEDAIKQRGKGKGNPMQMYVVKITKRADPKAE